MSERTIRGEKRLHLPDVRQKVLVGRKRKVKKKLCTEGRENSLRGKEGGGAAPSRAGGDPSPSLFISTG